MANTIKSKMTPAQVKAAEVAAQRLAILRSATAMEVVGLMTNKANELLRQVDEVIRSGDSEAAELFKAKVLYLTEATKAVSAVKSDFDSKIRMVRDSAAGRDFLSGVATFRKITEGKTPGRKPKEVPAIPEAVTGW